MNFFFTIDKTNGKALSSTLYRKELVYAGTFEKEDMEFTITEEMIDHWVASFSAMKEAGVEVPVPIEHTTDPEKRRGTVVGMEKDVNDSGKISLYGYIDFKDPTTADQLKQNQVSIFVPEERPANGVEKPLKNVISHVAITDYPVVNNLEGFEIAASLIPKKEPVMSLKKLAKELKLSVAEEAEDNDDDIYATLLSHITGLSAALAELKSKAKKDPPSEDPPTPPNPAEEGEDMKKKKPEPQMTAALGYITKTEKKSRALQIENLIAAGKITKPVAKDLKENFCNDNLSLSFDSKEGSFNDGFDATLSALSKNDPILSLSSRTGPQISDDENPLLKDALSRS